MCVEFENVMKSATKKKNTSTCLITSHLCVDTRSGLRRHLKSKLSIVGCQGVVQLGGLDPGFAQGGPTKVGACKSIQFTESAHVV